MKETQDLLWFPYRVTKANEFAILYNVNMSKDPPFPFDNYEEFSFDNFSDEECIKEFCNEKK